LEIDATKILEERNMWTKLKLGVGRPGKLWTGSDIENCSGKYAWIELVEFHSPDSGDCTRRLFVREIRDEAPEGIRIPTLHIFTGGVGSIVGGRVVREKYYDDPTTSELEDAWMTPLLVWNWSGRVGGYLILDPVEVVSGYTRRAEINSALPGYAWIQVYDGTTLNEYVLIRTRQVDPNEDTEHPTIEAVDEDHVVPIHRIVKTLRSPPERQKRKETCLWKKIYEDGWETKCGNIFRKHIFKETITVFCPYCKDRIVDESGNPIALD
jgi:hypothetical protein